MQKRGVKRAAALMGVLFAASLGMGTLASCGKGGNDMKQPDATQKDSAPISFTELSEVKINDAYAANGMEKEVEYLLKLDADKLLYYFYRNAGLTPKATSSYGGSWEGALIGGHTMGHYLSALAQAYANANTSASDKNAIHERIRYIVEALKECQDNAEAAGAAAGFLWGARTIPGGPEIQFDNVENNKTNISSQAWVPWYTMHKIIAGLYDCAALADDAQAKEVLLALCDWTYERVSKWSPGTQKTVLGIEYGGMNDILYSVYALTGEEKYAVAAHMFDEETLFEKVISAPRHYLNGLHANTTIPKIIGALNRYVTCHGKVIDSEEVDASYYLEVAETFWQYVIDHHTYVTGGNSEWEHFGMDDVLNNERTNANCETCNTYNMLKMSRTLFTLTGKKKNLDYYENTYYNAILSSQNPETGMTTYFQPMATGYFKVYSSEENHFWCCTGSGMESFSKLGDSIYYDAGNATYVSMYLASEYKSKNVSLTMNADLENSDSAEIRVDEGATVLRLRRPYWTAAFGVTVNDKSVEMDGDEQFVSVGVKRGDSVKIELKKEIKAYDLPDGKDVYAFLYGPFVLSAELGTENMTQTTTGVNVSIPALARGNKTISVNATSVEAFMADINVGMEKQAGNKFVLAHNDGELVYSYHFRQYRQRYGIYFKFVSDGTQIVVPDTEWTRTDTIRPGYGQDENDKLHDMQETNTESASSSAVGSYRKANAGGSFTYRIPVDMSTQNRLILTFAKEDNNKTVLVISGDTQLYSKTLNYAGSDGTYTVTVELPAAVVAAAQTISYTDDGGAQQSATILPVTFSGVGGAESARVCGIALETLYSRIAYFVDCGDFNVNTLSEGVILGRYNSVTEQVYGADAVTGKKWGIVDPSATDLAAGQGHTPDPAKGICTNSTWANEQVASDGVESTVSNRYTKDQHESGVARNLHYKFDLDNGKYTVKLYFTDPWGCSKNPNVSANGTSVITNGAVNEELTFEVTVTNGELLLDITSNDLCINICYIKILFAE